MKARRQWLLAISLAACTGAGLAEEPPDLLAPERVEKGRTLFSESCSYCHGEDGIGGESGAPSLQGRKDLTAAELFETISKGRINGMNIMPAWGDALTDEQRWTLVGFIRSMLHRGR
ncbi:MAG: cytochrome c [Betaproteobacteria bacterium]|nr:cytochrome c [Betaproteobacteria bacterium]